jgi:RNA polymerase sigma-70 factor (ECF subfamily)
MFAAMSTPSPPRDAPGGSGVGLEVARAAAGGDRAAAEQLLTRLLPRVRNLVRYLVRGDADVDDIAQDALVAILRGLPTYRGEATLESWSDRVVARVTFSALRRRRGEPSSAVADAPDLALVGDGALDEYLARREAVKALDRLPDEQRHALVLHHVLEMSVAEIADELGISGETIRSRLRLGKTRLRKLRIDADAGRGT